MDKCRDTFLDHFARLGVFNKVLCLAGPPVDEEDGAKSRDEKVCVYLIFVRLLICSEINLL